MTQDTPQEFQFSPKMFLKKRRPERFSDSVRRDAGKLDRALLEFQLSTLSRRSKELAFEDFAKKLCEKLVCPNLQEQTGPVAGGDGKVDTQTYPVTEQSRLLWYVGVNESPDNGRWAFAMSTQKEWKQKCKKDVRKIHATDRGYSKAIFVTNQYAKADQRSAVEDELANETGMEVRIFDVSWILDEIYKNQLEELAIETLGIEVDWQREIQIGSNDYARKLQLEQIDSHIRDNVDPTEISSDEVNEFLTAAVLSKELENPEIETQGHFERAVKVAEKFGTVYQQFKAHYQFAWAAYFWFENFELFKTEFSLCLSIAGAVDHASQWGDIVTLFGLYSGELHRRNKSSAPELISIRDDIISSLEVIIAADDRPSNSLMGEAYRELLNLYLISSIKDADPIFHRLQEIFQKGEKLLGFSHSELYNLVTELDEIFGDSESYENLLDYVTQSYCDREGRSKEALLWLKRGARRLDSGQPYQAIKLLGKSLSGLYQKDMEEDLYVALNMLAAAYTRVDLLWAARANRLMASSLVTNTYWQSGEINPAQVFSYVRMARAELRLGRIHFALAWWRLALMVSQRLREDPISQDDYQSFDAFLSQTILNNGVDILSPLSKLPDVLDSLGLVMSEATLLYVLGYEDDVSARFGLSIDQDHIDFLKIVRDTDIGAVPPLITDTTVRYPNLKTRIMGCEIMISFPFRTPFVELAETVLSGLEAMFATTGVDEAVIYEHRLVIEISADDNDEIAVSHDINTSENDLIVEVLCSAFSNNKLNSEGQGIIQEWLRDFLIEAVALLMRPKDSDSTFEAMFKDDRVLERAVLFSPCFVALYNVFGDEAIDSMNSVLIQQGTKDYPNLRKKQWDADFPKPSGKKSRIDTLSPGEGSAKAHHLDSEKLRHGDYQLQGLINVRLWDQAVWRGVAYMTYPGMLPFLLFMYKNESAGQKIFRGLIETIGKDDPKNRLRISIIRGIDKRNPSIYRVLVTENVEMSEGSLTVVSSRIHTMEPTSLANLERFLGVYTVAQQFILSFGVLEEGEQSLRPPKSRDQINILKSDLNVIDAWTIGRHSLEVSAIAKDDDPVIPQGIDNPPVLKVLSFLKHR